MSRSLVLLLGLALFACGEASQKRAVETAKIKNDTDLLGEAVTAVNDVLRAQPECDAVRRHLPVAKEKLDKAAANIATPTGQTTLEALRAQLRASESACPAPQ